MREHREQCIVFVVGVRRRLHNVPDTLSLRSASPSATWPLSSATSGNPAALRQDAEMVRQRDQDGKAKDAYSCWKDYQAFHVSASGN